MDALTSDDTKKCNVFKSQNEASKLITSHISPVAPSKTFNETLPNSKTSLDWNVPPGKENQKNTHRNVANLPSRRILYVRNRRGKWNSTVSYFENKLINKIELHADGCEIFQRRSRTRRFPLCTSFPVGARHPTRNDRWVCCFEQMAVRKIMRCCANCFHIFRRCTGATLWPARRGRWSLSKVYAHSWSQFF